MHAFFPFLLSVVIGLHLATQLATAADPAVIQTEFIYEDGPIPSCHASTIAQTPGGTLVTAWFGGTDEGHSDVGIWLSRREKTTWSEPKEVVNGVQYRQADGSFRRHPCWNPVLFQPRSGPLMLFYKVGPDPKTWWGMLTTSEDDGRTWSQPRRLPEHIDGPVKNKPVQLPNGDILCPSSTEFDGWRVHFERTSDLGKTWSRTGPVNDGKEIAAIQPSILFLGEDRLEALGRTRQGKLFSVESNDSGHSWGPMSLTSLPNPSSGTDAVTLKSGRHLLIYNHVPKGRSPLNVAASNDGRVWQAALVLESEPGEYSYPAVIETADGLVHFTYTWKRKRVRHVVVDPAKFTPRDLVDGAWPK